MENGKNSARFSVSACAWSELCALPREFLHFFAFESEARDGAKSLRSSSGICSYSGKKSGPGESGFC